MLTVLLLIAPNVFMTFAWYGHLKYKQAPLVVAILVSWSIAFFEYVLQVPANRIGHQAGFFSLQLQVLSSVVIASSNPHSPSPHAHLPPRRRPSGRPADLREHLVCRIVDALVPVT